MPMTDIALTNFNVPVDMRRRFDAICHASGRTRTSVLVDLMTDYILQQSQQLFNRDRQLERIDQLLEENSVLKGLRSPPGDQFRSRRTSSQTRSYAEFEPPEFMVSDGQEGW
jgi:hypothetical protein